MGATRSTSAVARAVAASALVILPGCGGDGGDATPRTIGDASVPVDEGDEPSRVDRLRGLPYAGSSEVDEGAARGVVLVDEERSWPGVNLVTIQMLSRAELIDASGALLRSWRMPDSDRWERVELLENGDLLAIGADPAPQGTRGIPDGSRYLVRFDWDGELLWKRPMTAHHDVTRGPDGRLYALTFRRRKVAALHPTLDVRDDLVVALSEEGDELERRSLLAGFRRSPDVMAITPVAPDRIGVEPWIDLFHTNSLEWARRPGLFGAHAVHADGNVLISSRHQNAVFSLDWSERRIVWAWGKGELQGPHDARLLENGNVLVFDNGLGRGWSRVVEVEPASSEIVWEYRADPPESFYTLSKGSSQRLPNGNTLIAESDRGRAFEVTREGEVVWDYYCPHELGPRKRAAIVRMIRIDPATLPTD
ncbi:MAG: arylsulfotransferase family protein [Planctomycetota bacterium]